MKLTQKELKECLEYDKETGVFVWAKHMGRKARKGRVAGCYNYAGYRCIRIYGMEYRAHRLAFLYMTGYIPELCDHINRIRDDNRWENLRASTHVTNNQNRSANKNNTSGYKGVSYNTAARMFYAQIGLGGKVKHIGSFTCKHHAFCEYVLMSRKHFGEFSAV